ncbi:hypothetical protein FPV67DRAFT_1682534 [Lyophyllum atratum]|nr:hypothetical protein FPV67DRAFT_1682534 [Lyophyllum atratum]
MATANFYLIIAAIVAFATMPADPHFVVVFMLMNELAWEIYLFLHFVARHPERFFPHVF